MTTSNLPQAAKPTVFHYEGRRLFLIDGEPRVVDVDLSEQLGREGERQIRTLIKRHVARLEKTGKLLVFQEKGELRYGSAVQGDILPLLRKEGLVAATGTKPTIAFLNKRQARWVVAKSETEAADDFLEKLLDLYDAWEAGTLEPARPAVEPPAAAVVLQPARVPHDRDVEFGHRDGLIFASLRSRLHVLGSSVAEVLEMTDGEFAGELSKWPQLAFLGEMPVFEGHSGFFLSKAHVTFLMGRAGAAAGELRSVAALMEAFDECKAHLHAGEVHFREDVFISGERVARRVSEAVDRGRWLPSPSAFLRCRRGLLRMRHDRVAQFLHRDVDRLVADVRRLREAIEDDVARVIERFEVKGDGLVLGLYLTMPHVARLCEFTDDSAEGILETFDAWRGVDDRLVEAMESDRLAFARRAASLRVDPGEFAAAAASAGAVEAIGCLRADLVAAGLLPQRESPEGDAGGKGGIFGLRRFLSLRRPVH
jgi:hypothetical protein